MNQPRVRNEGGENNNSISAIENNMAKVMTKARKKISIRNAVSNREELEERVVQKFA